MRGFFSFVKRNPEKLGAASYAVLFPFDLVPQTMFGTGIPSVRQIQGTFETPASPVVASTVTVGIGGRYAGYMELQPLWENQPAGVGL